MNFPSEPNETERTDFVHAALHEAARYEAETEAPNDLVSAALARHHRSGRACGQRRPVPVLVAASFGVVLLAGAGMWLHMPHRLSQERPKTGPPLAFQPEPKAVLPDTAMRPRIGIVPALLPPMETAKWFGSAGSSQPRHRIARHHVHRRKRLLVADNHTLTTETNAVHSVWTTETVHCEIVTQTLTPVWIAHADPETATIVLTPALFQLALQPTTPTTLLRRRSLRPLFPYASNRRKANHEIPNDPRRLAATRRRTAQQPGEKPKTTPSPYTNTLKYIPATNGNVVLSTTSLECRRSRRCVSISI